MATYNPLSAANYPDYEACLTPEALRKILPLFARLFAADEMDSNKPQ